MSPEKNILYLISHRKYQLLYDLSSQANVSLVRILMGNHLGTLAVVVLLQLVKLVLSHVSLPAVSCRKKAAL